MLVCDGAPQNIYGLGPRKAIIRPCEQNEVDGMKKGADAIGKVMHK